MTIGSLHPRITLGDKASEICVLLPGKQRTFPLGYDRPAQQGQDDEAPRPVTAENQSHNTEAATVAVAASGLGGEPTNRSELCRFLRRVAPAGLLLLQGPKPLYKEGALAPVFKAHYDGAFRAALQLASGRSSRRYFP